VARPSRRFIYALVLLVVGVGSFASAARAQTFSDAQAYRYRKTVDADIGTRSYIAGTGGISSGEVVASIQMSPPNSSDTYGGIQIGELSNTNDFSGNCGSGVTVVFTEWTTDGSHYTCGRTSGIHAFGNGGLFAVVNTSGSLWSTYWNSNLYKSGPSGLNFTHATPFINAEVYQNDQTQPKPTYSVTWGPSGYTAWQHMDSSADGYVTIDYSLGEDLCLTKCYNLGGTPSPTTISWAG